MPKRIELDDEQYAELENAFFDLDKALNREFDDIYNDELLEDYEDAVSRARDFLQGLIDEAEDVE